MDNLFNHGTKILKFLQGIPSSLTEKPNCILIISAHWEEHVPTLLSPKDNVHTLLFDYYGFPAHTYDIEYGAPTVRSEMLSKISNNIRSRGFTVETNSKRGLDHGVFIPMRLLYPNADIPIVQLSLLSSLEPEEHIKLGEAISSLRQEGVLILGSGMSYHNLRKFMTKTVDDKPNKIFEDWIAHSVQLIGEERRERLRNWEKASGARDCHPREEHLLPLFVCAGAAMEEKGRVVFSDSIMGAKVSAIQFG